MPYRINYGASAYSLVRSWMCAGRIASIILILMAGAFTLSAAKDLPAHLRLSERQHTSPFGSQMPGFDSNRAIRQAPIEYLGSCLWTQVEDVFVAGTSAWCAFGNGLCLLDITDVSEPLLVSELYIPCSYEGITGSNDILVDGNHAYIGDNEGVRIVDLLAMELVSTYPMRRTHTLCLRDDLLYAVDGTGLWILDIANPEDPDSVGFYGLPGAVGLDIEGDYAYVSDTGAMGLTIVSISSPEYPTFVSNYATPGYGNQVAVDNGYAFIADHSNGLEIVDVHDPTNPFFESHVPTSGAAYDVAVDGDYAFVAAGNVEVIDISDTSTPFVAYSYPAMSDAVGVTLHDQYLFSSERAFLEILNVADPPNAYLVGSVDRPYWLQEVRAADGFTYIADLGEIFLVPGGLKIVDVSVPGAPLSRGAYPMDLWAMPTVLDVWNHHVYMPDMIDWVPTLITIDVSNPDAPGLAGEYLASAKDVCTADTLTYILDGSILNILDLRDPENPSLEGSLPLDDDGRKICVHDGYAYIAAEGAYTLWIVDVSESSCPELCSSLPIGCNYTRDIVVRDTLAYVVCDQQLQIINVSDPYDPSNIGSFDDVTSATGIYVAGDYAYIANYSLLKVDIANPDTPSLVGEYPIPGCSYSVTGVDEYVYLTTGSSFMVFRDEDLAGGSGVDEPRSRPAACMLYQCAPNPVNSTTMMRYDLQEPARVNLSIHDVMGRTVRVLQNRASMGTGIHSVIWDGKDDGGLNVRAGV
ncbi:MAG: hypothetical protein KAY24_05995, partial [Candidatus Eisenbacteria sp.]|nr:hypothetical protein [Candidatus Eisenbacteria bacterium]